MKKLLFILLIFAGFASCSKDETGTSTTTSTFDLTKKVEIKEYKNDLRSADTTHLTGLEIVKKAQGISFQNFAVFGNQSVNGPGFDISQRDTITPCLIMWATDIVSLGYPSDTLYLVQDFLGAEDLVLYAVNESGIGRDTIAYIPNSVMKLADDSIYSAFEKKDYTTIYSLFNTAFTFIPITGAEWRALKAVNKE
jgi:hypothetical protein